MQAACKLHASSAEAALQTCQRFVRRVQYAQACFDLCDSKATRCRSFESVGSNTSKRSEIMVELGCAEGCVAD